jgi:hypothetical protein
MIARYLIADASPNRRLTAHHVVGWAADLLLLCSCADQQQANDTVVMMRCWQSSCMQGFATTATAAGAAATASAVAAVAAASAAAAAATDIAEEINEGTVLLVRQV